jgi:hypothetical protein
MSSEGDGLRFTARRATLRAALRDDDVRAAARAASRLRINGYPITPDELARARAVRRTLGLALIKARMPKPVANAHEQQAALPSVAGRSWRRVLAAAAAALLVLIALFVFGGGEPPGGGAAAAQVVEPQRVQLLTQSRGRTISLPQEIIVEASPTPTPTPEPTVQPTTAPVAIVAPSSRPAGTPAPSPGSGGSVGSGTGTGSGTGSGSGSGVGLGTPAPSPTPRVPPPGFSRLNVIVYDATTRRPLEDVCIVIGTPDCGPTAPHTAADGRWSADVAASSAATQWQLIYMKTGYATVLQQITLPGGVSRTYIIYLRRRG